mgnify:CR=1 FL=1
MSKKLLYSLIAILGISLFYFNSEKESETQKIKKTHASFLKNHPFNEAMKLSKKERRAQGLSPNKYFEQEYLNEINPRTGKKNKLGLLELQEKLNRERLSKRTPGDAFDNSWIDRGPNNVGGRTRAVIFDPNDETQGTRIVPFSKELFIESEDFKEEANKKYKRLVLDKAVRLRGAYVVKAKRCDKDEKGNVTTVYCDYLEDTLGKNPSDGTKAKGVIHWVDAAKSLDATVRLYDRLFTVPNPAAEEDFYKVINPESLITIDKAKVEPSLKDAKPEQAFQFERQGYFCLDNDIEKNGELVFNRTVGLRDTWAKISK